jgi:restriction system protein
MWKINSGRGSRLTATFVDKGVVAIGFGLDADFTSARSRDDIALMLRQSYPEQSDKQILVRASQAWRFLTEVSIGDQVLVYEPQSRLYHRGRISGAPAFIPGLVEDLAITRSVDWTDAVSRDDLSIGTKNSLGAILTVFKVPNRSESEIDQRLGGVVEATITVSEAGDTDADPFIGIEELALERVKDRLSALSWEDMQEIVASLLRALGYRTQVSPAGPDRGKDIIASKDGFGFERPRIVVEVKHRKGQMGAQEIRSFLGGRHADDRGLYVSTGGFTRDAQYEAERAATVTHLMTLDELAKALIQQYDQIDEVGRRLLPLTKVYWPA